MTISAPKSFSPEGDNFKSQRVSDNPKVAAKEVVEDLYAAGTDFLLKIGSAASEQQWFTSTL